MGSDHPKTFDELIASRKTWIHDILIPWCRTAPRAQLRLAELDWTDLAGKIAPEKSLWLWAWERFPDLVHSELQGMDEASWLEVSLTDGTTYEGHPDARESLHGELVLIGKHPRGGRAMHGPFSLDNIRSIRKVR